MEKTAETILEVWDSRAMSLDQLNRQRANASY